MISTLSIPVNKILIVIREIWRVSYSLVKTLSKLITYTIFIFGAILCGVPIFFNSEYVKIITPILALKPEQVYYGHLSLIKLSWVIALIYYPVYQALFTFSQLNKNKEIVPLKGLKSYWKNSQTYLLRYLKNYFCYNY